MVKIKSNGIIQKVDSAFSSLGLSYIKHFDETKWALLSYDTTLNIFDIIDNKLSQIEGIEVAEPNAIIESGFQPNDSLLSLQWMLNNVGQTGGAPDADIDAFEAWDITTGDPNLIIAVLDQGIALDTNPMTGKERLCNPDLSDTNKYILGYNCVSDTVCHSAESVSVNDNHSWIWHGTQVTSVLAAMTNNSYGIAGVIWNCKILVIKAVNDAGTGDLFRYSNAIRKACDSGAKILNCSNGLAGWASSTLEDVVAHAESLGCLIVAITGNEGQIGGEMRYPGGYATWGADTLLHRNGYRNVISVAATTNSDSINPISSYGDSLRKVIVTAPTGNRSLITCSVFFSLHQTSGAAPVVSGVAGLILSRFPGISPDSIRTIIENTADKIWQDPAKAAYANSGTIYQDWHYKYGFGRVNAFRAVTLKTLKAPLLDSAKVVRDAQDTTSWIKLFWTDISLDEDSFWIYRTILDTPYQFSKVASTKKDSITYKDHRNNLIGSETYIYRVRTFEDTSRSGNFSDSAKVTNIPRWPRFLTGTFFPDPSCEEELGMMESFGEIEPEAAPPPNCNSNLILLTWRPPSPQKAGTISEYKIHVLDRTGNDSIHQWVSVPDTYYYFCMCYGRTYDFWVHTKDIYGVQSMASNKISATGTGTNICCAEPPESKALVPDEPVNDGIRRIPTEFSLSQNYPNPFNLSTQIKYSLPRDAKVQIVIYNILGQKIKNFDLGYQTAGYRSVFWDGKDNSGNEVGSGIYFYRIVAGEFNETKKMTLLK
ncbi:MAG: hypothetical protein A2V73_06865 [candidate division Zixibacteria bacterium RBG_19FT_COMBO_42_43]|nr:MAG: hypothetical protein A2V73_06865 [candidate division Zixibacteria bacterium RBG_19FT_COMBO_42_43]